MKRLRSTLIRATGFGLLLGALAGCGRNEPAPEPVRQVRTMVVGTTNASATREFAAEVRARTELRLGFRVAGKLQSRQVEVGQRVRPGQVLARLDPADLGLSQQAAQAAVSAARVNRDLAQTDFARFKELREQSFISGAELDRRDAVLRAATAQLDQARAQAQVQANQVLYAALTAEVGGVVLSVDAEPGAVLGAGVPVLRLAVDGPRDVVFAVPEDAVVAMRALVGRRGALEVRLWAGGGPQRGTLREVAAAADPVTRTFQLKADLGAATAPEIGQTAVVVVEQAAADATLKLPLSAVREAQGRSSVWVFEPSSGTVRARPIALAGVDGQEVLVSAGLRPGERVVTAGVHVLTEGQVVRLLPEAAAGPAASAGSAGPDAAAPVR